MVDDDTDFQVRAFINGLHKRPVDVGGGSASLPKTMQVTADAAFDDLQESMRTKGQVRVQTNDDFVTVTISRKDGASIRMYGPFKEADKQREFICDVWRSAPINPKHREAAIAQTVKWRRFDEEE